MRAKRAELQVFSTSFLDLLTCAMGAFLLLYFGQILLSQQSTATSKEQVEELNLKLSNAIAYGTKLLSLGGEKKNVVFVLDYSLSMGTTKGDETVEVASKSEKWRKIRKMYANWIMEYPCEQIAVIAFNENVHPWQQFSGSSEKLRFFPKDKLRCQQIVDRLIFKKEVRGNQNDVQETEVENAGYDFSLNYGTNTYAALKAAYELPETTQIVLFTDGQPSVGEKHLDVANNYPDKILEFVRSKAGHGVVLNVIAVGSYYEGQLIQRTANKEDGMYTFKQFINLLAETGGGVHVGL